MKYATDTNAVMAEKERKERMRLELLEARRELDKYRTLHEVQDDELKRLRESRNRLAVELTEVKRRLGRMQMERGVRR